ncbi:MAG TPA: DapH/DapD/GlmU-related protein [Clostridia bacterium]|nr:DapH/DapD/GlmU-related protein [Clostridia bacterium]
MGSKSLDFLKADIFRITKTYSTKQIIKNAFFNRSFKPIFTMRICQHLYERNTAISKLLLIIFRGLHRYVCNKAGIDLSWKTAIGPGFCITHGWGTVISPLAVIGSNVTVFHGVTIGTKHKILENGERVAGYPIIKDNVWIGANSVIIGGITIGEGSSIAPMSMIHKDVAPHTIAGGNPQKILKGNALEDVYNKVPIESLAG